MNAVIYIHGKGGNAAESEHYKPLFPDCEEIGLDYQTFTPWETPSRKMACPNADSVRQQRPSDFY